LDYPPLSRFIDVAKPTIFFSAAVTGFRECEADPDATRRINVTNTLQFAEHCIRAGCFFVYLSSNAVFSGDAPFPDERQTVGPRSEYGRQKAAVEEGLQRAAVARGQPAAAIVRLTKVLPDANGLVPTWVEVLKRGQGIRALQDYIFSPISLEFVTQMLMKLAPSKQGGIFHLSGDRDLSYYEFAIMMAHALGVDSNAVVPEWSTNDSLPHHARFSALGMDRTWSEAGIAPQPPEVTVRDLLTSSSGNAEP
jgi:dTDP-4-dehydrorhamnose reductase